MTKRKIFAIIIIENKKGRKIMELKHLLSPELVVTTHENKFGTTIEQKQSRALKSELMGKVSALIKETYDVDTAQTSDGLYLLIPNDEEGFIPVLLDIKMKPLDTDIETLTAEYQKKQEEKAEKAAAAAAKKAKDIAAKQAKEAKKETEDAKEAE